MPYGDNQDGVKCSRVRRKWCATRRPDPQETADSGGRHGTHEHEEKSEAIPSDRTRLGLCAWPPSTLHAGAWSTCAPTSSGLSLIPFSQPTPAARANGSSHRLVGLPN